MPSLEMMLSTRSGRGTKLSVQLQTPAVGFVDGRGGCGAGGSSRCSPVAPRWRRSPEEAAAISWAGSTGLVIDGGEPLLAWCSSALLQSGVMSLQMHLRGLLWLRNLRARAVDCGAFAAIRVSKASVNGGPILRCVQLAHRIHEDAMGCGLPNKPTSAGLLLCCPREA
jgi:hypothetical protein